MTIENETIDTADTTTAAFAKFKEFQNSNSSSMPNSRKPKVYINRTTKTSELANKFDKGLISNASNNLKPADTSADAELARKASLRIWG